MRFKFAPDLAIVDGEVDEVPEAAEVVGPQLGLEEEDVRAMNPQPLGRLHAADLRRVSPEVEDSEVASHSRGFEVLRVEDAAGQHGPEK